MVGEKLANNVAGRFSRRGALYRMSKAACGLLGQGFASAAVFETHMNMAHGAGTGTCDHDNNCDATGLWGGMGGGGCAGYAAIAGCMSGSCPKGSVPGAFWQVCIKCKNDTSRGEMFQYWDCCGTPDSTACGSGSKSPSCSNNAGCVITGIWCGSAPGGYVCTYHTNTKQKC